MALISLKDQISVSNNGQGLPVDIRQQVDEYTDIFNLYQCYPGMRIYVKYDSTSKALTYPKGIYIVKSIYSGTGKPNLVEFIEDYLHISDKVNKPLNTPTTNSFISFDNNGNALDSGYNADSFAPKANAMPLPQQGDEGKILGYEIPEGGTNPTIGWVRKPSDGEDAYGVYVKQYDEQNPGDPEHQSQDFMSRDQWLEYNRGKSAREIYNTTYNKQLDDAEFAAELKMNYPMLHVGYDSTNAGATIGVPFSGNLDPTGDDIAADETTMGKLYLMPDDDSDPENCIGFVTVLDGDAYKWCNVGAIKIPSDVLAKSDVDNECINGTVDTPASANIVMGLKKKLQGVTLEETKVENLEDYTPDGESSTGYYKNDGTWQASDNYISTRVDVHSCDSIRFLGYARNSSSVYYGFEDENGDIITETLKNYGDNTLASDVTIQREYTINVPSDAYYFVCLYKYASNVILQPSNFYCYLQSGESVVDMIPEVVDNLTTDDASKALSAKQGKEFHEEVYGYDVAELGENIAPSLNNSGWAIASYTTDSSDIAFHFNGSANFSYSLNVTNYRGKRLFVKAKDDVTCYYAAVTRVIPTNTSGGDNPTLGDLTDEQDPVLCRDIHYVDGNWRNRRSIDGGKETYITIPQDASRIYFTGRVWIRDSQSYENALTREYRLPEIVKVETVTHIDGDFDEIEKDIAELQGVGEQVGEQVDGLVDELYGEKQEIIINGLDNFGVYSGMSISQDDHRLYTSASSPRKTHYVDINGCISLTIQPKDDISCVFFISNQKIPKGLTYSDAQVKSMFLVDCENYVKYNGYYYMRMSAGSDPVTIVLNDEAKYLYWQICYSNSSSDYSPKTLEILNIERVGGIIEQLSKEESNQGNAIKLIIKDGKCFTAPIPCEKGFHLLVNDDYRVTNAYLVDHLTGNIVNDDFRTFTSVPQNKIYRRCSNMCKMPGFDIIYQIERLDGSIIESSSGVIEEFSLVEDLYTRKLPTGVEPSIYRAWRDKVQTSIGNVWIPSLQAANKIPQSHENSNPKRFGKGTTYIGVNYSGPTQWGKHVGMQVSMRTFKTAVANPRSVMYTEIIGNYPPKTAQSKYGYIHNSYGKEAGAFYGCVCTGLTSYLMGFPIVFQSSEWDSGSVSAQMNVVMQGTTSNPDVISCNGDEYSYDSKEDCKALAELIQPMDFIWKDGHCAAISDVYVDEWGEVKYIVISEQTTPVSTSNAYTPEYFFLRFKNNIVSGDSWKILRRKSDWTIEDVSIPRTNQDKEFVVMNNSQYNPEDLGAIDPDITTFAGEYAVFVIGDYTDTTNNFKMFLNIHRGGAGGYTHIQIFNEDDDETTAIPVDEIDIMSYQTDSSLGTNGYILPSDEDEDWIIYNLAEYWRISQTNNTGKFKARVIRKESGSIVEGFASGCTHFMMVAMSLNLSNSTINYTVKGAIPIVYECESATGMFAGYSRYKNLVLGTDYTYNSITEEYKSVGTPLGNWTGAYLVLFANTDYGMANVKVAISNS